MLLPGELRVRPVEDPRWAVREATVKQWPLNRFLYQFVGGPWQWHFKTTWTDAQWEAYVASASLRTFVATYDGAILGYYELDRAETGEVEIRYFGLAREFIGKGFGGALLTDALQRAWAWEATRVWVHTCSLDHPAALPNYQARGMRVYRTETEA